ncbi:MAG: DNA gyrase subunit A [Schleiferiaceae bacterium]|jgi:DNA gyrase subunit A|nr:DNA gyrase subunit A [Schleiferiaceae bacterium]MDP4627911.1 DNA gyrase subunit A [Schleiferiaceae bacterium]MDP4728561.1 DNA gyrase subunit A [Schleiferiaceae bacterium]MDP4749598.1 DNA gyrase subunit A [Schleiferiaceae bacterium]MDP4859540.1 DNA gyrase subunit A [Schleiferiaceae bacterium]
MDSYEGEKIIKINIEEEMKSSYIDYSMSVIVSRALPDVRDGLKPVHRRVLFGMHEMGNSSGRPYKKSARVVGEVLGKYHPHGDSSVYDTMVRMAQDWSLRYTLVDGQGNFGSVDGDSPAAMRYTEVRLRKIAEEILSDIDKDTVDFQLNFDDSLEEPKVLPTRIPNLLVNGAAGIAVGMATNMPPHNLTEVVNATMAYIDDREISIDGLMEYVKAPDFPTGGTIYGYEGVRDAFHTGRGRVVLRGKCHFEEVNGRECIIATEIPYQVNKAEMIKKTADLINEKKLEGIADIRDESDRSGMRIVYVLKRDAVPNVVLNKLYKYTSLQSSFSVNNIALVHGRPEMLNLKDLIHHFVDHRHDVVVRRTKYELSQAEKRSHILEGLLIAIDHLDKVIALIRASNTVDDARDGLMSQFGLSEVQAKAILDLRLQKLTGLERDKVKAEYAELMALITYLKRILNEESLRFQIIKDELVEIRDKYGDDRRTDIEYAGGDVSIEDMIADEEVVITISRAGYVKRTPLTEYRSQGRGGVGARGATTRDEDFIEQVFVATNHNYLLLFTEQGRCFWLRVYEIPEGTRTSKGKAVVNLINIPQDDKVRAFINVLNLKDEAYINNHYVVLCTLRGIIKKTTLEAYSRPRANGINAITVREGDTLLEARLTGGNDELLMAIRSGKAIRFNESKVRPMGRNASGVRAMALDTETDEVVGMVCVSNPDETILVVSEHGYGKRTDLEDYRVTNRGGKGVKTLNITDKTGQLVAIKSVTDEDDLMITNKSGVMIRLRMDDLRVMGRATQGVRLINLKGNDTIASVAKVPRSEDEVVLVEEVIVGADQTPSSVGETPTSEANNESLNNENTAEA